MSYLPIIAIFGIGIIANIAIRKTKSRAIRMLIAIPTTVLMVVFLIKWI